MAYKPLSVTSGGRNLIKTLQESTSLMSKEEVNEIRDNGSENSKLTSTYFRHKGKCNPERRCIKVNCTVVFLSPVCSSCKQGVFRTSNEPYISCS